MGLSRGAVIHAKIVHKPGVMGVEVVIVVIIEGVMGAWNIPEKVWSERNLRNGLSTFYSSSVPLWLPCPPLPPL